MTRGGQDPSTLALFEEMRQKRRRWTKSIEKAKAAHWKAFLDKAGEGHLWKAASYMGPRADYANIPALKVDSKEIADNQDKANVFMDTFFPTMADPVEKPVTPQREEISWEPISKLEIVKALKAAKGTTVPGEDGIPTLVWKKLWKYVREAVLSIFIASTQLGYYPMQWKRAIIIVLRKPNKPDYSNPGAYRPISLLNTLGKLLEAVIAKQLSYYAETYGLLPDTQFGGQPGRNTEQALLVLANAIDRVWLKSKMVTLIAFDLKGAFNGVKKTSLDVRLQAKGIPSVARK